MDRRPQHSGKAPAPLALRFAWLKAWTAELCRRHPPPAVPPNKHPTLTSPQPHRDPAPQKFSPSEREHLLQLARQTVSAVANGAGLPEAGPVPAHLVENGLSFVTLTAAGALRGCVGHLSPKPLFQGVMDNARAAATRDVRFSPVRPEEMPELCIEISVLTEPRRVLFEEPEELLELLRPGEDGVWLRAGPHQATFLPQVWDEIPEKIVFLEHLSLKAGCSASAWREADSVISVYQVESFSDRAESGSLKGSKQA